MTAAVTRAVEPADLDAVTAIYADAVLNGTASYEVAPPDAEEMRKRAAKVHRGGFPFLVAELAGVVSGYAYAQPFRNRPAYRFIVEDSVYVAPGAKGRGLGRLLLSRLLAECESLGFRQMVAVIGDGREDSASVILHGRLGFRHAGRIEGSGFKHGRWLDTVVMQKTLNGGTAAPPDSQSLPERRFRGLA
jgi:L-amino acid N-acyltransferase YncA